jgi:hypothetical protein
MPPFFSLDLGPGEKSLFAGELTVREPKPSRVPEKSVMLLIFHEDIPDPDPHPSSRILLLFAPSLAHSCLIRASSVSLHFVHPPRLLEFVRFTLSLSLSLSFVSLVPAPPDPASLFFPHILSSLSRLCPVAPPYTDRPTASDKS